MKLSAWLLLMGVVSILAISMMLDEQEEDRAIQRYCEMVELNKTDQSLGWPDYRAIYNEVCK